MFNWLKKSAVAGKDAPESNIVANHADDAITQFAMSESEALKNQGNVHLGHGKLEEAAACFRRAIERNSGYAEAYTSLGFVCRLQGNLEEAVVLCRKAVSINPNLLAAHLNLGVALMGLGQGDAAEESLRQVVALAPKQTAGLQLSVALQSLGVIAAQRGDWSQAELLLRRALELQPDYLEAHFTLGKLLQLSKRMPEAEASYRRLLELQPDYAEAHNNLGALLMEVNRLSEAEASYRRALDLKADYTEALNNLGNLLHITNRWTEAEACYRRALELKPDYAQAHSNLGIALMELGKKDEAEASLSKATELAPNNATALIALLMLIPYQQDDPRFNQLEAVYARRELLPLEDRIKLNFAMGKAMESIRQYDRSFSAYEEGNRLNYQGHPFNEAEVDRHLEKLYSSFTADLFKECAVLSNIMPPVEDERVPVFIVGMPRSGTTLIEQILASHPDLYGAGELITLDDIARKAGHLLLEAPGLNATLLALRKLGQEYLDQVWKLAPDARYITDKMPGNFRHLGLIHLMLPNAKIIHSMRDPMDTCFSCYATQFSVGHEYSYDLGILGRLYLRYRKLMEHWYNVLPPGRILDMRYEDIVADPEREARRLLDYLGLPWNPACLSFQESKRIVRTASVTQVRKPIYSSSVARWKRFDKHLVPLLDIILPASAAGISNHDQSG